MASKPHQEYLIVINFCSKLSKIQIIINSLIYLKLSTWERIVDGSASYTVHAIELPGENNEKWRTLWRPCASQRLFLPVWVWKGFLSLSLTYKILYQAYSIAGRFTDVSIFQKLLDKTDALLYVDTDILFLRPLEDIWEFFNKFNSTQLAGVSPEHEPAGASAGWYNRFARHPYYGQLGRKKICVL